MAFKLGIGLPLTDRKVYSQFLDSWVLLNKPAEFTFIRPVFPGPYAHLRNQIVEQALDHGCSHLLMMDTDQSYPENLIERLLSHKVDVVAAKVHRRYPPFDGIMYRGKIYEYVPVPDEEIELAMKEDRLVEVDAIGTGCILYNTKVFFSLPYPWFQFTDAVGDKKPVGEDIGFCWKLRQGGYRIWVDVSLQVGHLTLFEVNWDWYKLYSAIIKAKRQQEGMKNGSSSR